jgi:subtilisin family serine protease
LRHRGGLACALLMAAAALAGAPATAATSATERVIVQLKPTAGDTAQAARRLTAEHGGSLGAVFSTVTKGFAARMPAGRIAALRANPNVAMVVADAPVTAAFEETTPGIRRIGAHSVAGSRIGTGTAVDVDIAVLDTGVNAHPDLTIAGGVDCTGATGCVSGSYADAHGHGTHVAGTAAAKDDGVGVVGTAPGARVWAVKVLGDTGGGYMSWFVAGLDWVVSHGGIEVVNASLGGPPTPTVDAAIARATEAGVVVVVAAGNAAVDAAGTSPASAPNAITVSAYQDNDGGPGAVGGWGDDTFASFSNYGDVVDVAAPGVNILSTSRAGGFEVKSGTSMASPHVAGAAAVYVSQHGLAASATRWQQVLDAFRGEWGAGQASSCGFTGGRSTEPVLIMGGCPGGDTVQPTTPSLAAVAGEEQVALSWTASADSSGIAAYRIYRAAGATGAYGLHATVGGAVVTYADTGLINGIEYRYYVVAVDGAPAANRSAGSVSRAVTPMPITAPGAPLLLAPPQDARVVLTWTTAATSVKAYQVWRAVGGLEPTLYKSATASARKLTDLAVVNGTPYRYLIKVLDTTGNITLVSNVARVTPVDNAPPVPATPTVTVGDQRLTLKWAAAKDTSGVASYAIYRAVGTAPFGEPIVLDAATRTWADVGLTNYTSYRYAMTATDVLGQTSPLTTVKTATPKDLTGPVAVSVSGSGSDGRSDLTWTQASDPSGVGSYQVLRAVGTATTFTKVATVPAATRSYGQTGLLGGTTYRYQVKAVDAVGNIGPASAPVTLQTPSTGLLVPTITYLTGTPGAATTPVTITATVRSDSQAAVPVAAKLGLVVRNGAGAIIATPTLTTGVTGTGSVRLSLPRGTTYSTTVLWATAVGRTWDGQTPANSVTVS